jgi:hypothetical protein
MREVISSLHFQVSFFVELLLLLKVIMSLQRVNHICLECKCNVLDTLFPTII